MAYFRDADELYELIGGLLQELATDPELGPKFRTADTVVQWRYRDPDAQITARLCAGDPIRVDLGDTDLRPDVVLSMDADLAHRFWLGRVNVTVALARGDMKARGPVAKILRLVPLLKPVFPRYEQRVVAAGRDPG